jgi:26S proteasome regulatory subunit T6
MTTVIAPSTGIASFYQTKIASASLAINERTQNLRRLEAQRNSLNARVRLLREELQLLQEPGSYVGEVVKVMGKKKVLVKVQPEGKYGQSFARAERAAGKGRDVPCLSRPR